MKRTFKQRAVYGSSSYIKAKALDSLSTKELRDLAEKRGLTISDGASRKEIISTLAKTKRD